jgi:hypothetical protein
MPAYSSALSSESNDAGILKQQWKASDIQSFDNPALLANWETNWPAAGKVTAKAIYHRAAGEVRVWLRTSGKPKLQTFAIERDLATTLQKANAFIQASSL